MMIKWKDKMTSNKITEIINLFTTLCWNKIWLQDANNDCRAGGEVLNMKEDFKNISFNAS